MPALLLGTLGGLLCAGVALWAGMGVLVALVVHMVVGALATLVIAWMQFTLQTPEDHLIADPVA